MWRRWKTASSTERAHSRKSLTGSRTRGQSRRAGFTAFICWTFQAEHTKLRAPTVGAHEYLRTQALGRIYLDNFPNVQSSWVTQGQEIGQIALKFGANDLGSIMIEENVVSQAGTTFRMTVADMQRLISRSRLRAPPARQLVPADQLSQLSPSATLAPPRAARQGRPAFSPGCGTVPATPPGMYLEYYGLKEPPFAITPNPRFLFYSAKHREAFNHLLFGIRERKGFVQLTGEVGAGKTTLCRALLEQLGRHFSTALILNPALERRPIDEGHRHGIGFAGQGPGPPGNGGRNQPLSSATGRHHKDTVLIIDEAQDLTRELLEQVRLSPIWKPTSASCCKLS